MLGDAVNENGAGRVSQMVEWLPSKREVLSSISNTTRKTDEDNHEAPRKTLQCNIANTHGW
jgi:hypothetical protein